MQAPDYFFFQSGGVQFLRIKGGAKSPQPPKFQNPPDNIPVAGPHQDHSNPGRNPVPVVAQFPGLYPDQEATPENPVL